MKSRSLKLTCSVGEILFRMPDDLDFFRAFGKLPVLPKEGEEKGIEATAESMERAIGIYDALLMLLAKKPKLIKGVIESNDDVFDLEEIPGPERISLACQLLGAGSFSNQARAAIDPLRETGQALSSSMLSADGTESGPANSSDSEVQS